MNHPGAIAISDYDYNLPEDRIAKFPARERDGSKLLLFRNQSISDHPFRSCAQLLPPNALLVGNNTKVIPARLFFKKSTGAIIEIFCLEPLHDAPQNAMNSLGTTTWKCYVGGAKKWKGEERLQIFSSIDENLQLSAFKLEKIDDYFIVRFEWTEPLTWAEMIDKCGKLPLPPYFNRDAQQEDYDRYQTIFAKNQGSVAAPTAGLHFTPHVIDLLKAHNHVLKELTLHVGAGTFKPVQSNDMMGHEMHREIFTISREMIEELLTEIKPIFAIGTTTTRAIESLYWLGVKLHEQPNATMSISQWEPYENNIQISRNQALKAILSYLDNHSLKELQAETSILIAPGYTFKIISGLFTNFHMPKSTLLLLIAAVTGETNGVPHWKRIYEHALANEYRFLSYGDSSLLYCSSL